MISNIVSALVVTTVVGFAFVSTRKIGLIGLAALSFIFPKIALVLLLVVGAVYFYMRWRK